MREFNRTTAVVALSVGPAAFGLPGPLFAAFIHVAAEIAFILNCARSQVRAVLHE